jgi:hypothetical protein
VTDDGVPDTLPSLETRVLNVVAMFEARLPPEQPFAPSARKRVEMLATSPSGVQ